MLRQADFWYVILWHLNYRWTKIQLDYFLIHVKTYFTRLHLEYMNIEEKQKITGSPKKTSTLYAHNFFNIQDRKLKQKPANS